MLTVLKSIHENPNTIMKHGRQAQAHLSSPL